MTNSCPFVLIVVFFFLLQFQGRTLIFPQEDRVQLYEILRRNFYFLERLQLKCQENKINLMNSKFMQQNTGPFVNFLILFCFSIFIFFFKKILQWNYLYRSQCTANLSTCLQEQPLTEQAQKLGLPVLVVGRLGFVLFMQSRRR